MNCADIQDRLSGWIDGMPCPSDDTVVEAHLADCTDCAGIADDLRTLHDDLERAFAPHRDAANAIAERLVLGLTMDATPPLRVPRPWRGALAVAASLALVVAVGPWSRNRPAAHLVFASHPVQRVDAAETLVSGSALHLGATIRTPSHGRCAFTTSHHATVTVDHGTTVALTNDHAITLLNGRIWIEQEAAATPLGVRVGDAWIDSRMGSFEISRASDEPGQWTAVVTAGAIDVHDRHGTTAASVGQTITAAGPLNTLAPAVMLAGNGWVTDALAARPESDSARRERTAQLRAELLASAVNSCSTSPAPGPTGVDTVRAQLANQLATLATPSMIPDLIALLRDPLGSVRVSAAHGLLRLTGEDLGRPPDRWLLADVSCESITADHWMAWWNRHQYRWVTSPDQVGP